MSSSATGLVPCPMCGSENDGGARQCSVCAYAFGSHQGAAAEPAKCSRCGSGVPSGYAFCPVCGLDQRMRHARPPTHAVQLHRGPEATEVQAGPPAPPAEAYPGYPPPPVAVEGYPPAPHAEPFGPGPGGPHAEPFGGFASAPPPEPFVSEHETTTAFTGPRGASAAGTLGHGEPQGPAQTGRTVFVDGPPLPRPPVDGPVPVGGREVREDDRTMPAPGRQAPPPEARRQGAVGVPRPAPPSSIPTVSGVAARLVLVGRDGEEGESFPVVRGTISVGRHHGDIRFPDDAFMSPAHARLERSGDVFTLTDTGSTNGIFLRIRGNTPVYPGDVFMVGHQVLRLENVVEPVREQPLGPDGTRLFGTPLKPAWGKLVLVGRGGVAGDVYFLRGAKVLFGREQGDVLFPQDPFVSREHARLRLELNGNQMSVFLEDLGSANGTYTRIRGSAEVRGRDTFRIGDQILRLRLDS